MKMRLPILSVFRGTILSEMLSNLTNDVPDRCKASVKLQSIKPHFSCHGNLTVVFAKITGEKYTKQLNNFFSIATSSRNVKNKLKYFERIYWVSMWTEKSPYMHIYIDTTSAKPQT